MDPVLSISPRITALPVIHGSGDCALAVRRIMLEESFDCLAVPLPPSFQADVEAAIQHLPVATAVVQRSSSKYAASEWTPDADDEPDDDVELSCSYVPIDPCQGVIAALRIALGEHVPRRFIDLETARFEPYTAVLPDAYALKRVAIERFSAAVLPSVSRPPSGQPARRIAHMAVPFAEAEMLALTVEFLQKSHELKLDFSPRDGINLLRYSIKRLAQEADHPVARDAVWRQALQQCLGDDALDLESLAERRNRSLGGNAVPLGLGDFFFSPDDPLHPDRDDEDEEEGLF